MGQPREFQVVRDETDDESTPAERAGTTALLIGLKALSQRALAAIADLFMLVTVGSAWWLWWSTPEPTPQQIVSLSIYACFVLAANFIVRRIR